jgi:uncharacterized protein (DUF169 family)
MHMATPGYFNSCGEELDRLLRLRTSPIALKLLEKETDIPTGAKRPKKDLGIHLAMCQAFAMVPEGYARAAQGRSLVLGPVGWLWAGSVQ